MNSSVPQVTVCACFRSDQRGRERQTERKKWRERQREKGNCRDMNAPSWSCVTDCASFSGVAIDGGNPDDGSTNNVHSIAMLKRQGKVKALEDEIERGKLHSGAHKTEVLSLSLSHSYSKSNPGANIGFG